MIKKWDKRFIHMAKEVASWSKDPSQQVGCIAVKDRRIIATGYNGFPIGIEDKNLEDREHKYTYTVHAEKNMIYNACRHGVSLVDSEVYVCGLPVCGECWKGLVQVGVKRVIMPDVNHINERWQKSCTCGYLGMRQVGVEVVTYKDEDLDDSNCGSEPVDCQTEKE
jgi:dCMP deaminase